MKNKSAATKNEGMEHTNGIAGNLYKVLHLPGLHRRSLVLPFLALVILQKRTHISIPTNSKKLKLNTTNLDKSFFPTSGLEIALPDALSHGSPELPALQLALFLNGLNGDFLLGRRDIMECQPRRRLGRGVPRALDNLSSML